MSLDEALLEYMRRVDAGEPVDREGFLATHRDCAEELSAYLAWSEEVAAVLGPMAGDEGIDDLLLAETADTLELEARSLLPLSNRAVAAAMEAAAPDHGPQVGASFHGLLIEEDLGRGRRFRARLGAQLVLLRLFPGPLSGSARGRFERRCAAWAQARHPAILPLQRFGVAAAGAFTAVPLGDGGDLVTLRCAELPPAARQAALLLQLARALSEVHGAGLMHGALHPGNVLLRTAAAAHDDQPLLTDFDLGLGEQEGASRAHGSPTALSAAPAYLSPEQARGGPLRAGPAVDVYGLGALLYYLLAGRPPYQGVTALETRLLVVREGPPPPRSQRPEADRDLEALCLRCLAREPADRPRSAAAVADALAALLAGPAPEPAPQGDGAISRALRWLRPR